MNPLPALLSTHTTRRPMRYQLLACAAVVAVSLVSVYVHVLHESMALGEQMRAHPLPSNHIKRLKAATSQTRWASPHGREQEPALGVGREAGPRQQPAAANQ